MTRSTLAARLFTALVALAGTLAAQTTPRPDPFTVTAPLASNVISSCGDLSLSGQVIVDSAGLTTSAGSNGGNVVSNGNVKVTGQATLNGNATAGPGKAVQVSGKGHVTGTTTVASSTYDCAPIDLTQLATTLKATNDNAKIPLTAKGKPALGGTNNTDFSIDGNDSITLPAGTYYFTSFKVTGGSTVLVSGPVRILSTGAVAINGGAALNFDASAATNNPFSMHLWSSGTSLSIANAKVEGFVYAPAATTSVSESSVAGGLFASAVTVSGNSHITRIIDDVPPKVAITAPANNTIFSDGTKVVVSGTASDDQTAVSLKVNGTAVAINADGTWSTTLNLSSVPSPVTITAIATDVAGNTATAKVTVQIIPPPVLTLVSPADGSIVAKNVITLTGSAGTAVTVTVNTQPATVANGTWTITNFDLGGDGVHPITIVGTNPGGSGTINAKITSDTTPPILQYSITPQPNGAGWNNQDVSVKFNCSDSGTGIQTCPADFTWSKEGAGQQFPETAVDKAGNKTTVTVTINLDKTSPVLTFTSPADKTITKSDHIAVAGTADDSVTASVNGTQATVDKTAKTFSVASIPLAEKANTITVTGTDIAGNSGSATITVTRDDLPPHVAITSPANNAIVNTNLKNVTVTGTATDDETSIASVTVNGQPATVTSSTWTVTLDLSSATSPATLTAVATDAAGNTANASVSIITLPPPVITLTSPGAGSFVPRVVTLTGSAGTATSVTVNNQPATIASGTWTLANLDLGADGAHSLTITGTNAGGSSTLTPTLVVDTTPPTIKATATPVANAAGWNNTNVSVQFKCDDGSGSGVDTCGPDVTVTQEGASQTITGTAKDKVGNTATTSITLNIDKTAPAMTITNYSDGQIVNTRQVKITGASDDATTASVNGVSAVVDTNAKTYSVSSLTLAEGINTVTASGTDIAGNTGTASIKLNLDDVPPKITISSPANNATVGNPTAVVISGTTSDAQTSVTSVQVNGQNATIDANGNWTVTLDLSKETSPVTVNAVATDAATNTASASISVVTVPPPVLTLTLPAPGTAINTRLASLAGGAGTADTVTVNGQPAVVSNGGWSISNLDLGADGLVTLEIVGTNIGGSTTIHPQLTLDTVPPTIQVASITPPANAAGWNNTNVTVTFQCSDVGTGLASCGPDQTISDKEGAGIQVVGTAVDKAGNHTSITVTLNIDKTPPHFTITAPAANAILGTAKVTVTGGSDDAISATVNGVAAVIDPVSKTFTATVTLAEGSNNIVVTGSDIAGNSGSLSVPVVVDTQAPQVTITSPAANACVNATALDIKGTVSDPHLKSLTVQLGSTIVTATPDSNGAWDANFTNVAEGKDLFTIQASDTASHTTTLALTVNVDRTKPAIAFTESGAPFTATLFNRAVSAFARVSDADPSASLSVTLDGTPYTQGTSITAEGAHTLAATSTDCAGNQGTQSIQFTIDRTPPSLTGLNPANGGTVGSVPTSITGTASEAATISILGTGITATTGSGNTFTLPAVAFSNGANHFTLHAVDAAGNASDTAYNVTVRSNAPVITITDNGTAIADGSLFNHAVTPIITADSPDDTVTATLNNNPFTSGTAITADGDYTLVASASDPSALGHHTDKTIKFTIDRTAPVVKITSPTDGATVDTDTPVVSGSAGDAVSVSVNGVGATISAGTFTANVPLDPGATLITAVGVDAAGNRGHDQITVNRGGTATGVLLTYPPDGLLTNRNTTVITGRVLTPSAVTTLELKGQVASGQSTGSIVVTPDPSGSFTLTNFSLFEGIDTITAKTTTASGQTASAIVHVTVDLTPPVLQVMAGSVPLDPGAHFPGDVVITATATDAAIAGATNAAPVVALQIDGASVTQPATVTAAGGHSVVATATDGAGNQTRIERTFFIGVDQAAGCALDGFDPATGSVVAANSTTLVGRTGGAAGVKINNIPASVANGMFAGTVELSQEGPNTVSIVCTDAAGNPTGTPQSIVLNRITAAPSVTIDSPAELAYVVVDPTTQTFTVSGTVQNATSLDVNGARATIAGGTYTATVHPISGLNILVAHARNDAGALSIASRRVIYLQNVPTISITWPADGFTTGAATVDVSGTYTNLDPTTLQSSIPATKLDTNVWSDTTGSFVLHGIAIGTTAQAITVTGHDALNRTATATINVTQVAKAPSITIASPANNSYLPAGTSIPVNGNFSAGDGSLVDVNGTAATTDTTATPPTFTGSVPFATSGPTPVTAHVTQPDGSAAIATAIVNQLATALKVKAVFPADGATAVDPGVMPLVSFTAPMDELSLKAAFSLRDASGTIITGQFRLDKDVLSFAAATTLTPGATYTIDIKTTAKDLAGNALDAELTSKFTIATTAPAQAPTINPITSATCGNSLQLSGTAPAGSHLEITVNGVPASATADATGNYTTTLTVPQASAYLAIRARISGEDGSYSPSASIGVQIDCSGPQVLGAVYDRTANAITITFSKPIDLTTVTVGAAGSVQVALGGTQLTGTVAAGSSASSVVITPAAVSPDLDPRNSTVLLTVTPAVKDTTGRNLGSQYSQTFTYSGTQPPSNDGQGFINGQVLDASNGRPLAGASVSIDVPINALKTPNIGATRRKPLQTKSAAASLLTDPTGHYTPRVAEGAYAIHVSGSGYTDVYRQVVVAAGQGVIPIDIRLTRRGNSATVATGDLTVSHGGDDSLTRAVTLTVPGGTAATGTVATLTAIGGQGLPGLLPLGWSPLAAAEVHVVTTNATPLGAATSNLAFQLPATVATSGRAITAVGYDATRDEWDVLQQVVSIGNDGTARINLALPATTADASGVINGTTAVALVYPDAAPYAAPPQPLAGGVLTGVTDPCATGGCPAFTANSFGLNPNIVLPTQRTVATLVIKGSDTTPPQFVSGSAVEALVNEELRLVDGSVLNDVPFSTDLILYRSLDGQTATADFHLAPSTLASQKPLQIGFDHIQVIPYPGRIDRGTLIGPAGGRVPSDDQVQVNIPAGATTDPLHATAKSMATTDLAQFGSIDGFQIVAGFTLTLDPTTNTAPPYATTQLIKSANATFTVDPAVVGNAPQLILAEVLQTGFGRMFRLADPMAAPQPVESSNLLRVSTATINPATLPVDGIIRPGQYLLLLAKQPIAFATGTVSQSNGTIIAGAAVASSLLGTRDLTRTTGIYAIPVVATPAAPFSLTPYHPTLGDGVPYTAAAAPAANAVVPVNLTFAVQAPIIQSVTVTGPQGGVDLVANNGATGISLSTGVQVAFNQSIDPASVTAASISVTNTNGQAVNGTTTATGTSLTWTLAAGSSLAVNSTYVVQVAGTIRGSHGAPLGATKTYTFSSVTQLTTTQINASKIRITIPDANGISTIVGDAGALPTVPPEPQAWRAMALRRGNAFLTQYQATANSDGSFSFQIGTCGGSGNCADSITINDHIDLQILNAAGNIAAVIPLTPFVTADGDGFIAPTDVDTNFVSKDGVAVHVPAGAFAQLTTVHTTRLDTAGSLANVPNAANEINFYRGVQLDFDCSVSGTSVDDCAAQKRLDVSVPVPSGLDPTGKTFLLGWVGASIRGPRVMVVDTLRVDGGNFTTTAAPSSQANRPVAATSVHNGIRTNAVLTGADVKNNLMGVLRSGIYNVIDLHVPSGALGWMAIDGIQGNYDLFWDQYSSLFASHFYLAESHGRVVVPAILNSSLQLVGVDAGTGLQAFSKTYVLQVGDPGTAYIVPSPQANASGPYPASALGYRVEVLDVNAAEVDITTIKNFWVHFQSGQITATVDGNDPLQPGVGFTLFDVTSGTSSSTITGQASVTGALGDRIVLVVGQRDVDPNADLAFVFDKPIYAGASADPAAVDAYLKTIFNLEKAAPPTTGLVPTYGPNASINSLVTYSLDSGNRRLRITLPSAMERGAFYRLTIHNSLASVGAGNTAGLQMGQVQTSSSTSSPIADILVDLQVRPVPPPIASFNLQSGTVRDLSLNGNILFIAALDGGIFAYDIADPGSLTATSAPIRQVSPGPKQYWAVASDQHSRVFATALGNEFGDVESFRIEDRPNAPGFVGPTIPNPVPIDHPRAAAIVSWTPGYSSGLDLATNTVLSDRPEGIPRKLQLAEQDNTLTYSSLNELENGITALGGTFTVGGIEDGFTKLTIFLPIERTNPYRSQRITVDNVTHDMRWSGDATGNGATTATNAEIDNVVVMPDDSVNIIFNERTYGVIPIFGYGLGIFDLNAMDSNAVPGTDADLSVRVKLTPANQMLVSGDCMPVAPDAIQDLSLSAEAAILPADATPDLKVYGLDVHKGLLDLRVAPASGSGPNDPCVDRAPFGLILQPDQNAVPPRMYAISQELQTALGTTPVARFSSIQPYHWELAAADNHAVAPPATPTSPAHGQRGSTAGTAVKRDYMLVPAYDYGLLVIDVTNPSGNLTEANIADLIWIPHGAMSVRVIPRSDLATVVDRDGRVLLVDVSHIDQRWDSQGNPIAPNAVFATAHAAFVNGVPDPRILWTSDPGLVNGTLAPVVDPETGFMYAGRLMDKVTNVVPVTDPRIQLRADLGFTSQLAEIGGIVPLGVNPPNGNILNPSSQNASLGAFRFELTLPGAIVDHIGGNTLRLAVESERVAGAPIEQTPDPFPRAHLRLTYTENGVVHDDPRPANNFVMKREIPTSMANVLRYQPGFNRFLSPWVVAIGDPRASIAYNGTDATVAAGCFSCTRPQRLQGLSENQGVWELWTGGRDIAVRPEVCGGLVSGCSGLETIFANTKYSYLASNNRLTTRFATTMADTVRSTSVLVAGQQPPVAGGSVLETVYLHSGEVETSAVDLDAGGRAGWNVVFDRTYRSRTLMPGFLGFGWNSSMFRHLRPLPDGKVEYRDGAGEVWTFRPPASGSAMYQPPAGLGLNLTRTEKGWTMIDMKRRFTTFDELGRLSTESDEFGDVGVSDHGNTIRYLYDKTGRLAAIVDPVNRETQTISYFDQSQPGWKAGRLKEIVDWRGRTIDYDYDNFGRLTTVTLPDVQLPNPLRPADKYEYIPLPSTYTDQLELGPELTTITEPGGLSQRVTFTYGSSSPTRAMATSQQWGGTNESVTYAPGAGNASVTDALGQTRTYELYPSPTDYFSDRAHVKTLTEPNVMVPSFAFGTLPSSVGPNSFNSLTVQSRVSHFTFDATSGVIQTASIDGVSSTQYNYDATTTAGALPIFKGTTVTPANGAGSGMPASASQPINIAYAADSSDPLYVKSVSANGIAIDTPEPHRSGQSTVTTTAQNDQVTTVETRDANGLLSTVTSSGGNDPASAGSNVSIAYRPADDPDKFKRALPETTTNQDLVTRNDYPDMNTIRTTDARGVVTTTLYDGWRRPVDITTTGPDLSTHESYSYYPNGRLYQTKRDQGRTSPVTVTTTYQYDLIGRTTSVSVDQVSVGSNNDATVTTQYTYNLAQHKITTTLQPAGTVTTKTLDNLGRTIDESTDTGQPPPIEMKYAYDLAGNLALEGDNFVASAHAYDAHGRQIATLYQDGTKTITDHDAWGRTTEVTQYDSSGSNVTAHTKISLQPAGTVDSTTTDLSSGVQRITNFGWDGAGRTTSVATSGPSGSRASHTIFDAAGRLQQSDFGAGQLNNVTDSFSHTQADAGSFTGRLPQRLNITERAGVGALQHFLNYDTNGSVIIRQIGALSWEQHFDQAGNLASSKEPARGTTTEDHDSRGAVTKQTMPGASNTYNFDGTGALNTYTDPDSTQTGTVNDTIGRPIVRTYQDGTTERYSWEGPRLHAYTDRQGRVQTFQYDSAGRLSDVLDTNGNTVDHIDYNLAGQMQRWTNKDAMVEYEQYDLASRPHLTRQTRFANSSGFGAKTILDVFEQTHDYNEHGERTSWSMPRPAGGTYPNGWTNTVTEHHDAAGNLDQIQRAQFGGSLATLMSANFRGPGRPDSRAVTTSCTGMQSCNGSTITRNYAYDNTTGQLNEMNVTAGSQVLAGSHITYEGLEVKKIQLLGVGSNERQTTFAYDQRGRVSGSIYGTGDPTADPTATSVPGTVTETLSAADFRQSQTRTPRIDPATRSVLQAAGVDVSAIDPTNTALGQQPAHKIDTVARGSSTRQFHYDNNGAQVSDDGQFLYSWDEKGRLISAMERPVSTATPVRRILYFYNGNNRLVGRRAEFANVTSTTADPNTFSWQLENRTNVLAADALPAETTFVWDPISDNLVEVVKAGATSTDTNGGLLKQIIHGGMSYDDPIEVTTATGDATGALQRLYPIYDEAGDGSLQAAINPNGQIVARNMPNDPYGADELDLAGAAVDRVAVHATKDSSGNLTGVDVTVRTTEALDPSTIATGLRLAAVDANGNAVLTSTIVPTAAAPTIAKFTLTPSDWNALTTASGAASLSVGVTPTLRAAAWSSAIPILPPPDWAKSTQPVYTSDALPVEVRQSLTTLTTWASNLAAGAEDTTKLYEVDALPLLGASSEVDSPLNALVAARFQAQPFTEPMTRKNYVRARWYDPTTGTWLSPDPLGYRDSGNLYAFAGGDPVNGRDPRGEGEEQAAAASQELLREYMAWCKKNPVPCRDREMRGLGAVRVVGGTAQTVAGVGAVVSTGPVPEPVTKTLGTVAIVRGIDNIAAGFMQAITGKQYDTITGRAFYKLLVKSGVSPAKASQITGWTEVGVDLVSTVGSSAATTYNGVKQQQALLQVQRMRLLQQLHRIELGSDAARGGAFSAREADTAERLEGLVGRLTRSRGAGDWVGANGKVYDAVGPVPVGHFNAAAFNASIDAHLLKSLDVVVVDLSGMNAIDVAAVRAHIASLSAAQQARILLIGR